MYNTNTALILMGGVDINPAIYGEKAHPLTQKADSRRDGLEITAIHEAKQTKKPIIGICRGAQLLCAVAGGTLWQDSDGHVGQGCDYHPIETIDGETVHVTSCHHQIMCLDSMNPEDYKVLAFSPFEANVYTVGNPFVPIKILETPEVVFFPKLNALAVQGHPEWMHEGTPFRIWLDKQVKELFNLQLTF
jgi:gamma-glutamyl-gamma-aminobutyrate hydrolase PuuD